MLFALPLGGRLGYVRAAAYSAADRTFTVPGSWFPLALMMLIYFTKYAVGVALARDPGLRSLPAFIGPVSLAYGLLSGIFLGGALKMGQKSSGKPIP